MNKKFRKKRIDHRIEELKSVIINSLLYLEQMENRRIQNKYDKLDRLILRLKKSSENIERLEENSSSSTGQGIL